MAFSLATMALGSLILGGVSTAVNVAGAVKNAKTTKEQLALQAQQAEANAELARKNIELAKTNAEAATVNAAGNAKQLLDLTEINANSRTAITDINVALADSISNFNLQVADGQSKIILGKGEMEGALAERNAQTAEYNANLREGDAQASLEQGNKDEQASRLNYARLKSTQRTNLAANGVVLDEGSALRIQTDTDFFSDVDAATIHANAVRTALGYRAQETNDLIEAQTQRIGGDIAKVNAMTEAASVKAQAFGAKMLADRDVLNMKMSTSFEILQSRSNALIESANILNQGRQEATSYEMQAAGFEAQANGFAQTAQAAGVARSGISPFFNGVAAGLDGAASVASKWYGYQKTGAFAGG